MDAGRQDAAHLATTDDDAPESLLRRLVGLGVGGIARLLQGLPEGGAQALAMASARAYEHVGGRRISDARVNLRIAFPEWSEARRRRVLTASLCNLGRGVVEFTRLGRYGEDEIRDRVRVEGLEHYETARAASPTGGVLAMTAHFGNWELLSAAFSVRGLPLSVVQRARDNRGLDFLTEKHRSAVGAQLLMRGDAARGAIKALRSGRILAASFDQNSPREHGVFVPFFGRLACTRTAPVRLAMRLGVPVLPAFLHREGDGQRHVARIHPAIELVPEGEDRAAAVVENAARMTRVIEAEIRRSPEEWTWIHRRWRTQPAGEPRPYS